MDHEVFVDKTGVDPEMKIGDSKGGVGVQYEEVVGMVNSSSKENVVFYNEMGKNGHV